MHGTINKQKIKQEDKHIGSGKTADLDFQEQEGVRFLATESY